MMRQISLPSVLFMQLSYRRGKDRFHFFKHGIKIIHQTAETKLKTILAHIFKFTLTLNTFMHITGNSAYDCISVS